MGESIEQSTFKENDSEKFQRKLREETVFLKQYFDSREFVYDEVPSLGLEVEAWLLDRDNIPSPVNSQFLQSCNDSSVVEELSKFNFEINTAPVLFKPGCFKDINHQLTSTWNHCKEKAKSLDLNIGLIGIHPLIRDQMLQLEYMSEGARYKALNNQVLLLRKGQPVDIDIQGYDHFKMKLDNIMIEAAATSIQVHIQANQEDFKRVYNASQLVAIPSVALAANSPYLYGNDLWDESRIPLFEQAIRLASFRDKKGDGVGRVTFGTGYVRHSAMELFLENLNGFPPLIPILFETKPEELHHLRFHNGTIWRWNRPIIGLTSAGKPHLRVEQRAMASGPSIVDIVANIAFTVGLTHYLAQQEKAPEESMTFTDCKNNFYAAAKSGLQAKVRWLGKTIMLDKLILETLIPQAIEGLKSQGIENDEIDYYINNIVRQRVLCGQNGSHWQRSFVGVHGRDFQALAKSYLEHQESGLPVHQWNV